MFYVRLDEIKNCGCKRPALLYFRRQFRFLD
uniref:Putative 4-hydroxyphenylacetate 3-hydroxylase small subunit n=1 Tax=Neisseria meningitidis alpha275 TaxID=295996 RepID=C6SNM7_NEIME|nr:putative 4-hydroxyphenylacetate 3-hydroxylase small subunit [Neisseria meningitidis alpha275]